MLLWWRGAGITPQISYHLEYTIWRCSCELDGMLASERIEVVDGSSHCVIKSSVSNLESRGRKKMLPFLGHDASSLSHSIA
jgi:hypothetical protein